MAEFEAEFAKIQKQLKDIQEAFRFIQESGLDQGILIAYLKDKSGMGKSQIIEILEAQDEFFRKLSRLAMRPKKE